MYNRKNDFFFNFSKVREKIIQWKMEWKNFQNQNSAS